MHNIYIYVYIHMCFYITKKCNSFSTVLNIQNAKMARQNPMVCPESLNNIFRHAKIPG